MPSYLEGMVVDLEGRERQVLFAEAAKNIYAAGFSIRTLTKLPAFRDDDFWKLVVTQLWLMLDAAMVFVQLEDGREFANVSPADRRAFLAQRGTWSLRMLTPLLNCRIAGLGETISFRIGPVSDTRSQQMSTGTSGGEIALP